MRYRRLTKQGRSSKGASPGRISGLVSGHVVFIKSKIICAVPSGSSPQNWTLCGRRRATGKGNGCVLSSAKIILLFRIATVFCDKILSSFDSAKGRPKTRGLFLDPPLVSLIAPPLSPVALLLWGEIGSCFLAPLGVRSVSRPSGWCALAHDALTRGYAHPRLAHSASFHFFAFTHHLQPTEILLVRCEGFCISMIYSGR